MLLANKQLPIGHGSSGARPFKYFLRESDQSLDVGFIKIFISTSRSELADIAQPSPLQLTAGTARSSDFVDFRTVAAWDTVLIPVVQRRPAAAAY